MRLEAEALVAEQDNKPEEEKAEVAEKIDEPAEEEKKEELAPEDDVADNSDAVTPRGQNEG